MHRAPEEVMLVLEALGGQGRGTSHLDLTQSGIRPLAHGGPQGQLQGGQSRLPAPGPGSSRHPRCRLAPVAGGPASRRPIPGLSGPRPGPMPAGPPGLCPPVWPPPRPHLGEPEDTFWNSPQAGAGVQHAWPSSPTSASQTVMTLVGHAAQLSLPETLPSPEAGCPYIAPFPMPDSTVLARSPFLPTLLPSHLTSLLKWFSCHHSSPLKGQIQWHLFVSWARPPGSIRLPEPTPLFLAPSILQLGLLLFL